jgi:hypothetical protein
MTGSEWNACTDPKAMLEFLQGKASERKLRLFAVACGRRSTTWQSGRDCTLALRTLDAWAEGQISRDDLERVRQEVDAAGSTTLIYWDILIPDWTPADVAASATRQVRMWAWENRDLSHLTAAERELLDAMSCVLPDLQCPECLSAEQEELSAQLASINDIFGNPFCPATFDRSWQTATTTSLAEAIYEERAFDRLPILADALEEVGCSEARILAHLRQPGEHVRGCLALDLVLQKE